MNYIIIKKENMKTAIAILTVILIVLVVLVFTTAKSNAINQKGLKILNSNSIPDSLNKIFMNSCAYCHSDGGKIMAKAKLNFSSWDNYSQKEKIVKGEDICKMLSEGDMPPKKARKAKPEAIPTDVQIKSICKWTATLGQ